MFYTLHTIPNHASCRTHLIKNVLCSNKCLLSALVTKLNMFDLIWISALIFVHVKQLLNHALLLIAAAYLTADICTRHALDNIQELLHGGKSLLPVGACQGGHDTCWQQLYALSFHSLILKQQAQSIIHVEVAI